MTAPQASFESPYVGPRTFTEEEGRFFFGRQREARDLQARVVSERLLLFYAQSGAGKSSLIRARLIPYLRDEDGFMVLPIGRVSGDLPAGVGEVASIYAFNLMASLDQSGEPAARLAQVTLSDFLAHLAGESAVDAEGRPGRRWVYKPQAKPASQEHAPAAKTAGEPGAAQAAAPAARPRFVLIVDQFEELITGHPDRWTERAEFFRQLNQALLDDPSLWVVLTLREDYVAALDPYADMMFNRLRARFYMERMAVAAALEAIRRPAELSGRPFAPGTSERLVDNLRQVRVPGQQGTTAGQYVEPVQLQVVCYQLWENVKDRPAGPITHADLDTVGDVDKALARFYRDALAAALAQPGVTVSERQLRTWVDRELVTEAGTRSIVYQGEEETGGIPNEVVRLLQDRFLLRAELRAGGTWLELTHDRLVEPVHADNTAWFNEHLSFVQKQAALWDAQQRPAGLLLTGKALEDAEAWAAENPDDLEAVEHSFLDACLEAREVRHRQRRQNTLIRWLAAGAAVFGVIALLLAVLSVRQLTIAQQERQRAETALAAEAVANNVAEARRVLAESAQAQAEADRDRAERQSLIARSRQAAAVAGDALRRGLGAEALLQAVASYHITDTVEAENVMHQALVEWRGEGVLGPQEDRVSGTGFSPDGRVAVSVAEQVVHLWEIGGQRRTLALRGHTKPVTATSWSPDGRFLATVSRDGTGRLWDRESGAEVWQVPVPREGISVAFAPDGQSVAFGGDDGRVSVWRTEPLSLTQTLAHASYGFPLQLQYSPDGELLAGAYSDALVRLWREGRATELRGHQDVVSDLMFSPDGQTLATRGNDDTVRLWRADTGEAIGVAQGARELEPMVWFSPDGRYVGAASRAGVAYLWETARIDEPPYVLAGHTGPVTALAFSPDGKSVATTSFDKTARLWDLETKTSRAVLTGHTDRVWWAEFSPDSRLLATSSADRTARLWNPQLDEGGELAVQRYGSPVRLAGLAADGERIVAVQDGLAHLWNPQTREDRSFETGAADIRAAAFDPVHAVLALADGQGEITLWDVEAGTRIDTIPPEAGQAVHSLAFDAAGEHLAAAREGGAVTVWNTKDRSATAPLPGHRNDATAVAFSPDGAWLASGSGDGSVALWDYREGRLDRAYATGAPVRAIAFSPGGAFLAAATAGNEIRIWDTSAGDLLPVATLADAGQVRSLAFGGDSERLAAGDEEGTVALWRWREGSPVRLTGHRRWVTEMAFDREGQRLVTAGQDGTVRVWPAGPELTAQLVCERVGSSQAGPVQPGIGGAACEGAPSRVWTLSDRLPDPGPVPAPGALLPKPGAPAIYYFEAVPGTRMAPGEQVTLRWDLANATEAYLYEGEEEHGVVAPDTRTVAPEQTTTYRLVARNAVGETERRITVTVAPR